MQRTKINPSDWGAPYNMSQGHVIEGATRTLYCSGQVAAVADSETELRSISPDDIRGQMEAALANVDEVLAGAGMNRANIVHVTFFTTDIDGFLENYDVYHQWIDDAGTMPPQSLIGVARLVMPEWKIEVEITAAD